MLKRLLIFPITMLLLIAIEGVLTFGLAFEFERYTAMGWIVQFCATLAALAVAEYWAREVTIGQEK